MSDKNHDRAVRCRRLALAEPDKGALSLPPSNRCMALRRVVLARLRGPRALRPVVSYELVQLCPLGQWPSGQ